MPWQRPTSVPYPSVWSRHTGRRPMPNGQLPVFRIQDAPEEMFDEIVDHMATVFVTGAILPVNCKLIEDPVSVSELKKLWRSKLEDKVCLVAIAELPDGTEKLAGANVTCISLLEEKDKKREFQGESTLKVLGLVNHMTHMVDVFAKYGVDAYMTNMVDVFAKYGVDAYMTALGLSVAPAYQGQGLGLEILKARVPLCKATGINLTATIFTAGNSQELARRAGFELLAQMEYKDYQKDGQEVFPGLTTKLCMNMALKIE